MDKINECDELMFIVRLTSTYLDLEVLFLFETKICSIDNVNFFPFVTAVSVFG